MDVILYALVHRLFVLLKSFVVHQQLLFVVVDTLHFSSHFKSVRSSVIFLDSDEVFEAVETPLDLLVFLIDISHNLFDLFPYRIELLPLVVILFDLITTFNEFSFKLINPLDQSTVLGRLSI